MTRFATIAFLLASILVLSSCTGPGPVGQPPPPPPPGIFVPDNAFGQELPDEAVLVSPDAFLALSREPDFRWESHRARAERQRLAEEQFAADRIVMQDWLAQDPGLARFIEEPDLADPSILKMASGNYLYSFTADTGVQQTVITMGQPANFRDLIAAQERFEDPENQRRVYRAAYELLPEALKAGLPSPESLAGAGLEEVRAAIQLLEETLAGQVGTLEQQALAAVEQRFAVASEGLLPLAGDPWEPEGFPEDPTNEEHAGAGSDRSGGTCGRASGGIYLNFQWPMKYFMTSTKNQGRRGSCVAFALTSAAESLVAVRDARWVNLSEQYLYHRIKAVWDPEDFDDGADTADMAEEFADSHYRLPFEDQWNYNPSPFRYIGSNADAPADFGRSCLGYGERCSNTTHQGRFLCTAVDNKAYCGSQPPNPDGQGYRMNASPAMLWTRTPLPSGLPLSLLRTFLAAGQPVVVALEVTDGFATPNANGFLVTYDDDVRGGHAMHMVGYVSNSQLQDVLPNAPQGGGGGYFILKNSWGTCYGDGGLVYVPVNWAKNYFKNITVYVGAIPSNAFLNTPPSIEITTPADGAIVQQGTINLETFTAQASDDEDGGSCCAISWSSDVDGPMGSGASIEFGFATPGQRVITATAVDSVGASVGDSITIDVQNSVPVAQITAPVQGEEILRGLPYTLLGQASDVGNLGGVPCNQLVWTSSKTGDPSAIGCNPQVTFTTIGPRTLTLTATDTFGAVGTDTVDIVVVEPPELWAAVTRPKPDDLFFVNDTVTLEGKISQDFDLPATFEWRAYTGRGQYVVIASGDVIYFTLTRSKLVPNNDWIPSTSGLAVGPVQLALFISGANGSVESERIPITLAKLN